MEAVARPTWVASDRVLARYVARPVLRFIHLEVASGVLLLVATAAALIWANSAWSDSYGEFWHAHVAIGVGSWHLEMSLAHFVNDGLMALFFFVVGLEIKRELVTGELADRRAAALPAIAAVGGMVVPALFFVAFAWGSSGVRGWGIPMATDIAFAVGVVALLGSRVSPRLKLFLLTLAIVDDIGAIAVIAIFYSEGLSLTWLGVAVALLLSLRFLRRVRVWTTPVYAVVGAVVWYATYKSGVHATIAGVAMGLMTPALPLLSREEADDIADDLVEPSAEQVRDAAFRIRECVSVGSRLETLLHPFTSFVIIPIFALANAGIVLSGSTIADSITSPVTLGVVAGLVIGKPVGITLFTYVATRFGFDLPDGINWRQFVGMGMAAGIGFTVSIFVTGLAYADPALADSAKIGILGASFLAAVGALLILRTNDRTPVPAPSEQAELPLLPGDGPPSAPIDVVDQASDHVVG